MFVPAGVDNARKCNYLRSEAQHMTLSCLVYTTCACSRCTVLLEEPSSSEAPTAIEKVKNMYQSCLNTSKYSTVQYTLAVVHVKASLYKNVFVDTV